MDGFGILMIGLIILVCFLVFLIIRLAKKNESLEELVLIQDETIISISNLVKDSDERIRVIDYRGSFEADDEIGFFFKNLKEINKNIVDYFEKF
jgi:hypothetical protein